jgi:hypothetical protein
MVQHGTDRPTAVTLSAGRSCHAADFVEELRTLTYSTCGRKGRSTPGDGARSTDDACSKRAAVCGSRVVADERVGNCELIGRWRSWPDLRHGGFFDMVEPAYRQIGP